jgi:hypothetical protein
MRRPARNKRPKAPAPAACENCRRPRSTPLAYGWDVHVVRDDQYERGYRAVLTCSVQCRDEMGLTSRNEIRRKR